MLEEIITTMFYFMFGVLVIKFVYDFIPWQFFLDCICGEETDDKGSSDGLNQQKDGKKELKEKGERN